MYRAYSSDPPIISYQIRLRHITKLWLRILVTGAGRVNFDSNRTPFSRFMTNPLSSAQGAVVEHGVVISTTTNNKVVLLISFLFIHPSNPRLSKIQLKIFLFMIDRGLNQSLNCQ